MGPLESASTQSFQMLSVAIDEELRRPDADLNTIKPRLSALHDITFPSLPWSDTINAALQTDYVGNLLAKIQDVVCDKLNEVLHPLPDPVVGSPDVLLNSIRASLAADQIKASAASQLKDLDSIIGTQAAVFRMDAGVPNPREPDRHPY
jgi:hypothetical protein